MEIQVRTTKNEQKNLLNFEEYTMRRVETEGRLRTSLNNPTNQLFLKKDQTSTTTLTTADLMLMIHNNALS